MHIARSWRPLVGAAAAATVAAALWGAPGEGALAAPATAKTFDVTSSKCTGPGSLVEAVANANKNPGRDTIRFRSGLVVDAAGCPPVYGDPGWQPGHYFFAKVTESVTFEGNGAKLGGTIYWINESGDFNPSYCPDNALSKVIRLASTPGFLEVGQRGADNSGIDVAVHNLKMDQVSSVARVRAGGSLELDGITATKIYSNDQRCGEPAILLDDNSSGRILNSTFASVINNGRGEPLIATGLIQGFGARHLYVYNSTFSFSRSGYGLLWSGKDASATANVVSSRFSDAEGVFVADGHVNVVNSAFAFPVSTSAADRFTTVGGSLTLKASTVSSAQALCNTAACRGEGKRGSPLVAVNRNIAVEQTAVGIQVPQEPGSTVVNSAATDPAQYYGSVTADRYSWISPVAEQSAATLKTVTGQPDLLTDLPGLPTNPFASFTQKVTPVLYRVAPPAAPQPGVLLDVIPDAAPGQVNQLLNPETGQPLTTDVFGSPRVDNNGRRNIGAVQMTLAPRAEGTRPQKTSLDATWTRPADPGSGPITGYGLYYRAVGGGGYTRIDISRADTLSRTLTGLTPDTSYEFYVVGVNAFGDGPPSNVVTDATTPDPHLSYPSGKGQVGAQLDPLKPQIQDVSAPRTYVVSSGSLPKGLSLDPTTGEISGTPQQSGKTTLQITVIGTKGTASAELTIDVSARPLTPHLSYPTGKGEQGHAIDPLTPQADGLSGTLNYEVTKGSLPTGLVIDRRTGVISGTPREHGTFTATVRVTGANGTTTAAVTIEVRPSATPYLQYGTVTGHVGKPVAPRRPQASGLTGTVSYAITRGTLPRGLSFDTATGIVSATAHRKIDRTVRVTATGANGTASAPARILITRPATPLTVDARRLSARLTVGKTMKVIQKVTASGTVRVRTTCRVHGAVANRQCDVRVTPAHKVYVTPLCNEDVSVTVRIDAKVRGKDNTRWERTWRVNRTPHVSCTAKGTG